MTVHSGWSLQKTIYEVLAGDPQLVGLLGGQYIYDDVPQRTPYPYVTLDHTVSTDWSTGTEDGEEHVVTLHVWSQGGGKNQTYEIIGALKNILHDQKLQLSDHHLVNLRHEFSNARRDPDGEHYHGIVRYRAKTEPVVTGN